MEKTTEGGAALKNKQFLLSAALVLGLVLACWAALSAQQPQHPDPGTELPPLQITEICTKNDTILADNSGSYRDYIELYNSGDTDVNLAGYTLTDGSVHSAPLPDLYLPAGGYRVLFLGKDVTGFGLSASGDCIQLLDPQDRIVTQTNTAAMTADQVMLLENGNYTLSADASPGFPNDAAGIRAFRQGKPQEAPSLVISEYLAENKASLPDLQGNYSDVLELCNITGDPINLGLYCLSDSQDNRFRFRLPDQLLLPGQYCLVLCDSENTIDTEGMIHANFSLASGETLCLTDANGCTDAVPVTFPGNDISMCRTDSGSYTQGPVSLGYDNTEDGAYSFALSRINTEAPLVISEVLLSGAGVPYQGTMQDVAEIVNRSGQTVSTEHWYLSDGGNPYAYPLPRENLAPGESLVVVCSRQNTGFSLSEGEFLTLTGPDYRFSPRVACVQPEQGMSILLSNEAECTYTTGPVSIGFANTEEGQAQFLLQHAPQGLIISEVMTDNTAYLKGPYATTCDWVELYNAGKESVNLGSYCLSDDPDKPDACPLPEKTLEPGQHTVLLLSKKNKNLLSGYDVLPLSLSDEGEWLYLSAGNQVADWVSIPALSRNAAYGRESGQSVFCLLAKPTPGKANSAAAAITDPVVAVTPQGVYDDVEYVDVTLSGEGQIYYTTNATTPNKYDKRYTGPIRLKKTTVIRAICIAEGKKASKVVDLTYVINEKDNLPVVTLVTEPKNLWNENTGIYVEGLNAAEKYPHKGANYWMDWEKKASISLFETDGGGFSSPCGIKIHGAFSRAQPKKSLAVFFRGAYGPSQLDYPLFGEQGVDTYEAFVLRSGGQDSFWARIRDELITSLADRYTDLIVQNYRPVVVYINGEYFGLHYIREKINEHFVSAKCNVEPDTVTIAEYNGSSSKSYKALVEYAASHDLSKQEYYDQICTMMNVDQYMDYIIAQICVGNTDNSNVKFCNWEGGKWHWILYDTDLSMLRADYNAVANHLNPKGTGGGYVSTRLINSLLKNKGFRQRFLERMAWQMDTIWSEQTLNAGIDHLVNLIEPDMAKDCARWNVSVSAWNKQVSRLRSFAANRYDYLVEFIREYFDLTKKEMRSYGFRIP